MTNVVKLNTISTLPNSTEDVLNGALEADLEDVIVIGRTKNDFHFFASTSADGGDILWLMEQAKMRLLQSGGVILPLVDP